MNRKYLISMVMAFAIFTITCLAIFALMCLTSSALADELDEKLEQEVSLFFRDEDIHSVMSAIGNTYGLNILIDKDVEGKVTVNLLDVPL